jgi:uncharacterized protein YndB with AHSA1/START domain/ketosteroid isomerase-like protein
VTEEAVAVVEVAVDPGTAFEVFTSEASAWWHRDRSLWGPGTTGAMRFEPGVGGRLLLERGSGANEAREVGRVEVWEPTPRLVFSYGAPGDAPERRTEVEVRFEATETGTRVVLRHRGWLEVTGMPTTAEVDGEQWAEVLAAFARHSLEHTLLRRLGEFLDAIGAGDVPFFERYLTDDALLIFPGRDNVYTKAQGIAAMADHPPYIKYDMADPRIVHIGESTAVLTHRATVMHAANTQPRSVMVSSVLVHEGGAWRLALHQWTPADDNYT